MSDFFHDLLFLINSYHRYCLSFRVSLQSSFIASAITYHAFCLPLLAMLLLILHYARRYTFACIKEHNGEILGGDKWTVSAIWLILSLAISYLFCTQLFNLIWAIQFPDSYFFECHPILPRPFLG